MHTPDIRFRGIDRDTGSAQRFDCHVDVRNGGQGSTRVAHREALGKARCCQQKSGHELAGLTGVDVDGPTAGDCINRHGERQGFAFRADIHPELSECRQNSAHRANAGLRIAVEAC